MMNFKTPEAAGIDSRSIIKFIKGLEKQQLHMHSVLLARGDSIVYEGYWAPFNNDYNHRMYSVTKSFVSIAIGLCEEDGLLSLDDCVFDYFPDRREENIDENVKKQTIRQMLKMTTVGYPCSWFVDGDPDRTHIYFRDHGKRRCAGTIWEYDSAGSQVLASLVERVTGKSLFDFLNERIFTHLGTFKNARILKTPNGDSWGDSAMICTTRDLYSFARFVLNYGTYNGKRLMNEEYLKQATKKQACNRYDSHLHAFEQGYGYQIWIGEYDCFAFVGMGDELAVCFPHHDLIFCCTADNQGSGTSRDHIVYQLYDCIIESLSDTPLDENPEAQRSLDELTRSLSLFAIKGQEDSPMRKRIDGVLFECDENKMKLSDFVFKFDGAQSGTLTYTRDGNKMDLPFYVNKNRFGLFPELGYSREYGAVRTNDGHMYKDAVSLAWVDDNVIMMSVQIIDDYFGNATLTFAFNGDQATVQFSKTAEDFLWGYDGQARAKKA